PNEQEFQVPAHTGNEERPFIPSQITVLPIPEKVGSDIESLPMPEEKDFRDYILIFPIPNMPPVYVYLSKPRNGLPQDGHDYHPAPKTEEITGVFGLRSAKKKTPKQSGGW
ncbi:S-type pyocin domain-containing protein, partial [Photorhabdus temperata]|uniref:S-type pyocin domain-containing protein n=1 Tax=Photorhabdus temperata TaxID=574560 RepID=UPI00038A46D1